MANLRVDKITSTETFETTGSVQFDGNGGYLSSSTIISGTGFGINDFTVDFWIYPANANSGNYTGILNLDASTSLNDFQVAYHSSNIQVWTDTASWRDTGFAPDISSWTHISFVRNYSSNTLKMYANGVEKWSVSNNHDYNEVFDTVWVGRHISQNTYLNGFISNIRIVNGTALYTSNFKPSMRELEVVPGTVLLACQSKTDASLEKTGKTITVNGNAVASELTPGLLTPIVKSGGGSAITGSVEFTGSSILEVTSTDLAMGDSDLTMECWFYNGVDTITHLVQIDVDGGATNFSLATRDAAAGDVRFLVRNDSSSNLSDLVAGAPRAKINMWHHLAGTIEGTTTRLFLNGILIASGTISGTRTHTGDKLTIGANEGNRYLKGYMSNVRIVKGKALYTDNFTPPTRELKNVPGTVVLACQDPDDPFTEATGKTLNGFGDFQRSNGREYIQNGSFIGGYTTEWEAKNSASISHTAASNTVSVTSTQNYSGIEVKSAYLPTLTVGKTYAMTVDIVSLTNPIRFGVVSGNTLSDISTAGKHTLIFTGTSSTTDIFIEKPSGSNSTFVLNSVSIKEVDGIHPSSNFTPQVGDDRKVTFEGVTKMNSNAYFYLPTGNTESREATGTYNAGTRGLFGGGNSGPGAKVDTIEYITLASTGNGVDFGNLTNTPAQSGGCASNTRGIIGGGYDGSARTDVINHLTVASRGNAADFGNLTIGRSGLGACSNATRAVWSGGYGGSPAAVRNTIDYVTIPSVGNAQDFGDLLGTNNEMTGCASPTRGIFGSGDVPGDGTLTNTLQYITIATTGNTQDFGDLTIAADYCTGFSNSTRGIFYIGYTPNPASNIINYITISSTGNAVDFGDAFEKSGARSTTGASSSTRGVVAGGDSPAKSNSIEYVTIATTGNGQDFGALANFDTASAFGLSNGHGGLG